jgi:hypothetical protein
VQTRVKIRAGRGPGPAAAMIEHAAQASLRFPPVVLCSDGQDYRLGDVPSRGAATQARPCLGTVAPPGLRSRFQLRSSGCHPWLPTVAPLGLRSDPVIQ